MHNSFSKLQAVNKHHESMTNITTNLSKLVRLMKFT
jgi:hypothetical protein